MGSSLQFRLSVLVFNTLVETSSGIEDLVSLLLQDQLQSELRDNNGTIAAVMGGDGSLDLSAGAGASFTRRTATDEDDAPVAVSKVRLSPDGHRIELIAIVMS